MDPTFLAWACDFGFGHGNDDLISTIAARRNYSADAYLEGEILAFRKLLQRISMDEIAQEGPGRNPTRYYELSEKLSSIQSKYQQHREAINELEREQTKLNERHGSLKKEASVLMDRYRTISKEAVESETNANTLMHRIAEKRRKLLILEMWKRSGQSFVREQQDFVDMLLETIHSKSSDETNDWMTLRMSTSDTNRKASIREKDNQQFTLAKFLEELSENDDALINLLNVDPGNTQDDSTNSKSFSKLFLGGEKNADAVAEIQKHIRNHIQANLENESLRKIKSEIDEETSTFLIEAKANLEISPNSKGSPDQILAAIITLASLEGMKAVERTAQQYAQELQEKATKLRSCSSRVEAIRSEVNARSEDINNCFDELQILIRECHNMGAHVNDTLKSIKHIQASRLSSDISTLTDTILELKGWIVEISESLRKISVCPLKPMSVFHFYILFSCTEAYEPTTPRTKETNGLYTGSEVASIPLQEVSKRLEIRPFLNDSAVVKRIVEIKSRGRSLQAALISKNANDEITSEAARAEERLMSTQQENSNCNLETKQTIEMARLTIAETLPVASTSLESMKLLAQNEQMMLAIGAELGVSQ
ncbi:hypothetical protein HDU97_003824 [Phlyctochytrium planicorne]|nr:hypothetical protein HDU97_003824 [Phlyctochytrium planicorne]